MTAPRSIIVIGGSAGAVEALIHIAAHLPTDLDAAVFVTVHVPSTATSNLPRILTRAGPLLAIHPGDGDSIEVGRIYVAPPDHHLLIHRDVIRLARGPTDNGIRPAIDPMFRSAALAYGNRVIGVVITGNLDDGTAGLLAIKRRGGRTVVQDPEDALFPTMPASALRLVKPDAVARMHDIPSLLVEMSSQEPRAMVSEAP